MPSQISVTETGLGAPLMEMMMADQIVPGSEPSYQLCKTIYTYHPLGGKMVDAPINMAQSQARKLSIQDAPEEVLKEFEKEWGKVRADENAANVTRLSRIYGIGSIILGCEGVKSNEPLDMEKIWQQPIFFNVLDPLNTAGSLVLSQVPTSLDFNKPVTVRASGEVFHRSRYQVLMNEAPVYLEYTGSAFGFVGRSVYQRALFPLKSFLRSMIADDMIAAKLGLLIAKQATPSPVIDAVMQKLGAIKRALLKDGATGNVLQIGLEEEIATLNMENVDGAGTFARTNIIKNIATAADMPAKLLDNETLVGGFGEGTEDAKNIARYIERIRMQMQPVYAWFDNIVQYRAWNPDFYKRVQANYPEQYGERAYHDAFSEWRRSFAAEWPSLLIEPESEAVKKEEVRLQGIISTVQTLLPVLDPKNQARLVQWAADSIGENKMLFTREMQLDYEDFEAYVEEQQQQKQAMAQTGSAGGEGGESPVAEEEHQEDASLGPEARKVGRFG